MFKSLFLLFFVFCLVGCEKNKQRHNVFVEPRCLPSQSQCSLASKVGELSILFNVERVLTEQMFNVVIRKELDDVEISVKAHLEGKDMFMGKIPLFFKELDNGDIASEILLGSCSDELMVWRMFLTITSSTNKDNDSVSTEHFIVDFESSRS